MKALNSITVFARRPAAALLSVLLGLSAARAEEAAENDYFGDLPVVLSVSRLAQPLNEVPGAVTVIDADTIRRSGAREVADVLRLVPGFLVAHRNGGSTIAAYHSALDIYGARMQVYVDGRSVYSSFLIGDTHRGLAAVDLENIERIEVLRGSNSAAFGANAFLGVINIVTKAPADTRGATFSYSRGDKGIDDNFARVGWAAAGGEMRLSVSRRATTGYETLYDDSRRSNLQFRGDFHVTPADELSLSLGVANESFGEGVPPTACGTLLGAGTCDSNKQRTDTWRNGTFHAEWSRVLSESSALKVKADVDQEFYRSAFIAQQFPTAPAVVISAPFDTGGKALRQSLEVQRTDVWSPTLRTVVGAETVREQVYSPFLFSTSTSWSATQLRVFGGVEWKPRADLVFNAGGLWERHSMAGGDFAPRLSVNYHLAPEHTLRAGTTQSFRAPSIYMLRGRANFQVSVLPALVAPFALPYIATSGNVRPESVISTELGYLGDFRAIGLKLDVRAFDERLNKRINFVALDFVNLPGPRIHGVEYQVDWRPREGTRLLHAHSLQRAEAGSGNVENQEAPHRVYSLAVFQDLPYGVSLGAIGSGSTAYTWGAAASAVPRTRQLDLRLAKAFRIGASRAELAATVQAVGGGNDYLVTQQYTHRAFLTLRLDY